MEWIEKVDETTKEHLKLRIIETHVNEEAIKSAKDQMIAQLWIAIADISKQMKDVSMKIDYLERALQDMHKENMKTTSKEDLDDIKKAMDKIMKGQKKK